MRRLLWLFVLGLATAVAAQVSVPGWNVTGGGGTGTGTVTNTGGALTANSVVLGAGGNDTKVSTGITTNGASELDLGLNGTAAGVLGLNGSTSGKATLTAPAAAGTVNNGIISSNSIVLPVFTIGAGFDLQASGIATQGIGFGSGSTRDVYIGSGNFNSTDFNNNDGVDFNAASFVGWCASGICTAGDTMMSRISAGVVGIGTTNANPTSGTIKPGLYATGTNCAAVGTAANPSVASCTAAAAGAFSCATNASTGTCQVNTTAVTANSRIFVQQSDAEGANLSVTCNTGITVSGTAPLLASKAAGASFTINLGTVTVNPACFIYWIVN
jgi:hypothetical protein